MINLSKRSYKKELLDNDDIPFADIRQNMKELNTINTLLGGHKITVAGLQKLIPAYTAAKTICICEIGCGGGDNLKAIESYCNKKKIAVTFIGIDIKDECIAFAKQQYPGLQATWITSDYQQVNFGTQKPDIIFSSLFCHHFKEEELTAMLQWMKQNAATGFFINDLHRHPLAYYSIKWITALFSKSYLVKNDAPLSVARGFKKAEWNAIFKSAGITNFFIKWKWAFRYLVICRNV
ncbi:MAG: methyltransferase domain-containing protein [Ferruginibacter sp.]